MLGFGSSGSLGEAQSAVTAYIEEGRSVLISYAGAQEDTGRLGLDAALLGQTNDMTYSKLGRGSGEYYPSRLCRRRRLTREVSVIILLRSEARKAQPFSAMLRN